MQYICIKAGHREKKFDILKALDGELSPASINFGEKKDKSYTRTHCIKDLPISCNDEPVKALAELLDKHKTLFEKDVHEYYRTFQIPKRTGGWRKIDAPKEELVKFHEDFTDLMRDILMKDRNGDIFEMHHTSAYAYIENRCTKDCLMRHQYNQSKWFAKTDLHNFFGSTTKEFILNQFRIIYPLSQIMNDLEGAAYLSRALDLCLLDGGLPQGTKVSPWLTNLIMIPIDHELANTLHPKFVYTRYADDMQFSSKEKFNLYEIHNAVKNALKKFGAPYELNLEKSRFGSINGRNWNLGLMLNKDNEITIGSENIAKFKIDIHNFILDSLNDKWWSRQEVEMFQGRLNYYRYIQPDRINEIINKYNNKYSVDTVKMIKMILKKV